MALALKNYDVAEHLDSEDELRRYLEAAFEDGDATVIAHALGNAARARGMTKVAAEAGISRAGLYKALGEGGNPSLETLSSILRTLGMRLSVTGGKS
ncbi:MAG: putative addiction module antidote protein [Pseudomonadota bacterium]|nr:putative addiction module antidote protein [Pseudomonadota bacterium]